SLSTITSYITSNVTLTAATATALTSFSLAAGTWIALASMVAADTSSTTASNTSAWISTVSAGGTHLVGGFSQISQNNALGAIGPVPASGLLAPAGVTTYYLNAQSSQGGTAYAADPALGGAAVLSGVSLVRIA
ncbi:MAG TPA: hypothetical protein VFA11_10185, partial [Acidimicrobiales bacterium]|nr:hypothetical protein [Acidimicrobiales bacterium]